MSIFRPALAAAAALSVACAGDTAALRRDVAALRADLARLERASAAQGERVERLAERVAALQGTSPMVVLAPPASVPAPAPAAAARRDAPPLVPPHLQVVKVEPEPAAADLEPLVLDQPRRAAPRARPRGGSPPPVPTSVPLVEPQGAVP